MRFFTLDSSPVFLGAILNRLLFGEQHMSIFDLHHKRLLTVSLLRDVVNLLLNRQRQSLPATPI